MTSRLDLFPLRTVLVPGATLRLHVFEDRYKRMIAGCLDSGADFGVVLNKRAGDTGDDLDPVTVGTTARIAGTTHLPQGRLLLATTGVRRFRVDRFVQTKPFWAAEVSYIDDPVGPHDVALALRATALERFKDYLQALMDLSGRKLDAVGLPDDPGASSFLIADAIRVEPEAKQALLESPTVVQRLTDEVRLLERETRRLRVSKTKADESDGDDDGTSWGAFTVRISLN